MNFPRTLSPSNALVLPPADHHDHDGDDDGDDDDDDDDGDGDGLDKGLVFGSFLKLTTCTHMCLYLFEQSLSS